MQNDILACLTCLSDQELLSRVKGLVARERDGAAEIIAHLAEMDTRDIHLREGYPSLFLYCRDVLRLSEWEAYNRIEAARTARRFPVVLDLLADGSIHLTAVRMLAPHLTAENHRQVLQTACGKTKAEVQLIVATLAPRPDAPFVLRKVAAPPALPSTPQASLCEPGGNRGTSREVPAAAPPASAPPRASATPLSTDRYRLQVTIDGETLEMFHLATDMLGHAIPDGSPAAVLNRAFRALLSELARKTFAETSRPRAARAQEPGARSPSAAVKRAVWVRDLGRCAFIGTSGHRCNGRRFVEFHHVDPRALGGEATVDGTELRCRRHNDYEGRLYFGKRRRRSELVPEQAGLSTNGSHQQREIRSTAGGSNSPTHETEPPCP